MRKNHLNALFSILLILAFVLTACAPAATPTAAQEPTKQEPTKQEPAAQEPAKTEPTATTAPTEASAEPEAPGLDWLNAIGETPAAPADDEPPLDLPVPYVQVADSRQALAWFAGHGPLFVRGVAAVAVIAGLFFMYAINARRRDDRP